jgi:PGF-pre-PGF domain-containing protein
MLKIYSSSKSSLHRRKQSKNLEVYSRKPRRIAYTRAFLILTVFSLLLSFCGSVGADYVMHAPPDKMVVTETNISVSLTTPSRTVFINVADYNACQIVKNVTVEFREPVTYVGFALEVLSDIPNYEDLPGNKTVFQQYNETVLQYYTIRLLTASADEITNVEMVFAVEKDTPQEKDEVTLVLYQYDGRNMEECQAEKFEEDDDSSYFKTTTERSSYIAITRVLPPTPWWYFVAIIAMIALTAVIGIYVYRRFKLANLREMLKI